MTLDELRTHLLALTPEEKAAVLYKKNLSPEEAIETALFYSEKDSLPCP